MKEVNFAKDEKTNIDDRKKLPFDGGF